MNVEIWIEVGKRISNPNKACKFIAELMENCNDKTFNSLIATDFSNPPKEVRKQIETFIFKCNKGFETKAVYLEMNGFDINPDRWFFDFFGYDKLPDNFDDIYWLSDYQSPVFPDVTLVGLESIQKLFEVYQEETGHLYLTSEPRNKDLDYNHELATLMVMVKFCKLIDESIETSIPDVHVFATAHDFDIVYHKCA